jgi:hypothetical protein
VSDFPGWEPPVENWSKVPHKLIELMPLMNKAELRVTLYLLRHTWGWGEYTGFVPMTVDEFMHGRRVGRDRIDNGTGLSKQSVITGLKEAKGRGTIEEEIDERDKARVRKSYRLRSLIDQPQRSKKSTAAVKKLDPEHNKDTDKESSPPPAKRKQTKRERFAETMARRFSKTSGIPMPGATTAAARKKSGVMWFNPLWALYKLHRPEEERMGDRQLTYDEESLSRTLQLIDHAVQHCRAEKLTLSTPRSIENVAISQFAEGSYVADSASDDFWMDYA